MRGVTKEFKEGLKALNITSLLPSYESIGHLLSILCGIKGVVLKFKDGPTISVGVEEVEVDLSQKEGDLEGISLVGEKKSVKRAKRVVNKLSFKELDLISPKLPDEIQVKIPLLHDHVLIDYMGKLRTKLEIREEPIYAGFILYNPKDRTLRHVGLSEFHLRPTAQDLLSSQCPINKIAELIAQRLGKNVEDVKAEEWFKQAVKCYRSGQSGGESKKEEIERFLRCIGEVVKQPYHTGIPFHFIESKAVLFIEDLGKLEDWLKMYNIEIDRSDWRYKILSFVEEYMGFRNEALREVPSNWKDVLRLKDRDLIVETCWFGLIPLYIRGQRKGFMYVFGPYYYKKDKPQKIYIYTDGTLKKEKFKKVKRRWAGIFKKIYFVNSEVSKLLQIVEDIEFLHQISLYFSENPGTDFIETLLSNLYYVFDMLYARFIEVDDNNTVKSVKELKNLSQDGWWWQDGLSKVEIPNVKIGGPVCDKIQDSLSGSNIKICSRCDNNSTFLLGKGDRELKWKSCIIIPLQVQGTRRGVFEIFLEKSEIWDMVRRKVELAQPISAGFALLETTSRLRKEYENAWKHALDSAIAAIMARNWAHIFYSQILLRFRLATIGGKKHLLSDYIYNNKSIPKDLRDFLKKYNVAIPEGLLDYMVTRSEYIANVTGEIPLLWGEGYIEYWDKNSGKKIGIIPEFQDTVILEKLCEAAGGKFEKIEIKVKDLDERIGFPFGAATGRHAIYGILENYIRNVSKYGYVEEGSLCVQLSKSRDERGVIIVKLTSNSKIDQDSAKWNKKAEEINKHVSQPIIDETGALPSQGWGFREMKIHACLLAGQDISSLLEEGVQDFFKFDFKSAKTNGEYCFYFKVRKYEPILRLKNEQEIREFIEDPLRFPLADFVVLNFHDFTRFYNKETWAQFPIRLGVLKGEPSSCNWLQKRVVFLERNVDETEEVLYAEIWKRFWDLLVKHCASDYGNIIIVYRNECTYICDDDSDKESIAIYHADDTSQKTATGLTKNVVLFSHQKCMMIWINEVYGNRQKTDKDKYVVNDEVIKYKWKTLLGSKILLVDTRLFEQYSNLSDEIKEELCRLGVKVIPESAKMDEELCFQINDEKVKLEDFQFVSIHLGYLEENPDSPLLKEENLDRFPPFIFIHTARGKIDREFVERYWWFRKIVSVGSLLSAFREVFGLEIKIRIVNIILSPQQGGIR